MQRRQGSPDWTSSWGCLLSALLLTFYVNFVPFHLATETHLDNALSSSTATTAHDHGHDTHDGHDGHDGHDDGDHHVPHPASDHALSLTASAKAPSASVFTVLFRLVMPSVILPEPAPPSPIPVFERIRPPGESPPDPLQPRAPPFA